MQGSSWPVCCASRCSIDGSPDTISGSNLSILFRLAFLACSMAMAPTCHCTSHQQSGTLECTASASMLPVAAVLAAPMRALVNSVGGLDSQ
jgi:hypothetical protein